MTQQLNLQPSPVSVQTEFFSFSFHSIFFACYFYKNIVNFGMKTLRSFISINRLRFKNLSTNIIDNTMKILLKKKLKKFHDFVATFHDVVWICCIASLQPVAGSKVFRFIYQSIRLVEPSRLVPNSILRNEFGPRYMPFSFFRFKTAKTLTKTLSGWLQPLPILCCCAGVLFNTLALTRQENYSRDPLIHRTISTT